MARSLSIHGVRSTRGTRDPARARVLVLNERDPRHPRAGGAEVHVQEVSRRLVAHGHAVTHAACGHGDLPPRETIDGVEILRLGPIPVYYLRAAALCARGTRDGRFDVVVEHLNKLPFLSPAYARAPVIGVCHHLFGREAFRQVAWPVAAGVWASEKLIPWVYRRTPVVAVSESTRRDLVARGLSAERIPVIHNGVVSVQADGLRAPSERPRRIAYLGRLEPYKRVDLLLRAAAGLKPRFPDLELVVVGRGTDAARLERLAAASGITGWTHFAGFVPDGERDALVGQARVVACPSLKEGWGLTVLEANALGAPVVATDAPGLRDAVRHGETGFLVPEADEEGFAERLAELLADDALADRMGAAARAWAGKFDWDAAAREMEALIERERARP